MTKQEFLDNLGVNVCQEGKEAFMSFTGTIEEYFLNHKKVGEDLQWYFMKSLWFLKNYSHLGTELTELDLSNNELTTLPNEIGQLKNLRILDLGMNHLPIEQIHKALTLLPQLKRIWLGDLGLTTLPDAIFGLKKLKKLFLSNYSIEKNPNNFSAEEQEKIKKLLPNCEIKF